MFQGSNAFASFAVGDLEEAKKFYGDTLGLQVGAEPEVMWIHGAGGGRILVYPKQDHTPASFTVLNFSVDDIESAVDDLSGRGITFERYDDFDQDDKGIAHGPGPAIAWFEDPWGNVVAVMHTP